MVKTRNSTYEAKQEGQRVTRAAAARGRCFTADVLVDREGQELLAGRVTRKKGNASSLATNKFEENVVEGEGEENEVAVMTGRDRT